MEAETLVEGPSGREVALQQKLSTIVLQTKTGAYYMMPDLTREQLQALFMHLDTGGDTLVIVNVSEATLVIPQNIVDVVYLLVGRAGMHMKELWKSQGQLSLSDRARS